MMKKTKHSRKKSILSQRTAADQTSIDDDDLIKPDDQLILSPEELDEQHGNILYTKEPSKVQGQKVYSIKNKKFVPKMDRTTFLIKLKSSLLGYGSVEAEIQTANESCRRPEVVDIKRNDSVVEAVGEEEEEEEEVYMDFENNEMPSEEVGEEFQFDEGEMIEEMSTVDENNALSTIRSMDGSEQEKISDEVSEHSIISLPIKPYCAVVKLKNKFSFFDRYTNTKHIDMRNVETQSPEIRRVEFRTFVSLTDIYDAYSENLAILEAERDIEMKKKMAAHIAKRGNTDDVKNYGFTHSQRPYNILNISKTTETVVSFRETEAIAQDFRYYEDQADKYRGKGEGTLMMMWSFVFNKEKTLIVTDISWNPHYFDLFGVTLSIPLNNIIITQTENSDVGYVCLWSLKNSSYPQVVNETHSGATCLSFHRNHSHVYAIGLRDGSLAVYNMSVLTDEPQYITDFNAKHKGCVRQVEWREDLSSGEMNFYSISDDGTVCQWILLQNEMVKIVKILLTIDMQPELELCGVKQTYAVVSTTMTFNPKEPEQYLVGTNEGYIFKCNTEWCSYVRRFRAHSLKVNQIDFNKFNPNIYITCSEDFIVKLWEDTSEVPLMLINLKTSLSDVRWSPFSSSVFCVITDKCRAFFYDLDVNTKKPVCNQLVHSSNNNHRIVRLSFDRRVPLIIIGSSKSTVISFKLSPNLRTIMKSPKKGIQVSTETLELEKLQKVLLSIRGETD